MHYFGDILGIGTSELLIILVIILLLFGAKKLPELFRNAGSSVREFKKGIDGQNQNSKTNENKNSNQPETVGK